MSIIHVLADGREVENITGHVVSEKNASFYRVVDKIIEEVNSKCTTTR